jgi:hypothetical protein
MNSTVQRGIPSLRGQPAAAPYGFSPSRFLFQFIHPEESP